MLRVSLWFRVSVRMYSEGVATGLGCKVSLGSRLGLLSLVLTDSLTLHRTA